VRDVVIHYTSIAELFADPPVAAAGVPAESRPAKTTSVSAKPAAKVSRPAKTETKRAAAPAPVKVSYADMLCKAAAAFAPAPVSGQRLGVSIGAAMAAAPASPSSTFSSPRSPLRGMLWADVIDDDDEA
jgi:nucleoid-associated protein YgaU